MRKSELVRSRHFVSISGTEDIHVRHGTKTLEHLNRLVSGTIFSKTNGIMCHYINDTEPGESRESHGAQCITGELQKSCTVRAQASISKHSIRDSSHSVFPDTKSNCSSFGTVLLEIFQTLDLTEIASSQISTSSNQFWEVRRHGIEACFRKFTSGSSHILSINEFGKIIKSTIGYSPGKSTLEFSRFIRVGLFVFGKGSIPFSMCFFCFISLLLVVSSHIVVNKERFRGFASVQSRFHSLNFIRTQRSPVRFFRALLAGRSVSNLSLNLDK
mmetsp:Transcript_26728/g.56301  ORF Transcript_26728/g.56301 Transcript_26728/m.56301 type:complete len:272 (-) Transcript_26728:1078-1893(-)